MNLDPPKQLTVLSLNCWGLYVVSKKRKFRLEAIADKISQEDYDLVALQEVWMPSDVELIQQKTQSTLPFAKHFYSGALGSGLVILSRFPILSSSYLQFSLAGRPFKIFQGDFYVGKGLGSVCIDHPDIGLVDVYTTHLQASYGQKDDYEAQRITECWQIAQAVRNSAAQGRHVILAGDFNSIPTSHCYCLLKEHGFMTDSWLEMHQDIEDSQARFEQDQLSISECIQHFGITCDSPVNTWTKHLLKQEPRAKDIGDRLDYIFYRRSPQLVCLQSSVVLHEYIPNTDISFSDHFGVRSVFKISTEATSALNSHYAPTATQLARPTNTELTSQHLRSMLMLIQAELSKAVSTRYACLFGSSVLLLMTFLCWTGQIVLTFQHPVYHALLGLYMIFSAAGIVVFFIVGFVFGKTEERLLLEYKEDMTIYLNQLTPHLDPQPSSSSVSLLSPTSSISSSDGLVIKPY
ncbi:Inositol phosphosphingolipids phospholipase C [Choanephora cucurbitarum]|uniref:Inositol phosphosphingolipids phospholipase C n=1 Tax=Choanephora cucurbitarum TaxID=101091 RepID=A0A1C7NDC6_9FUNG|nr:Inositol phosphosphingolipids phospholipase C [Choanephora cucurbitarum]